ncbi:MAG: hypothetical protein LUC45_07080, partial [Paraprevotella sp.]|nr:hypothetical protein [Paraprevotella sp.]
GGEVCTKEEDVGPVRVGAWFHNSIEDARLTYNDLRRRASMLGLDDGQAFIAVELVYALTNDKGRTRTERAGEKYYAGIRSTPYAPLVKMADRAANIHYSVCRATDYNHRMASVYRGELPHFLAALRTDSTDRRFLVPEKLVERAYRDLGLEYPEVGLG